MWTVEQFIAGISSLTALATAIATFQTVREMAKQRKTSLKPDLISVNQRAYVYAEKPALTLRYFWSREQPAIPQMFQHSRYSITILNIGFGAAKQLRAEWMLDVGRMTTRINELARQASIAVSVERVPDSSQVRILWPDRVVGTQEVANQLIHEVGHVLPVSLDRIGFQIEVPSVFLTLASLQISLGLANQLEVSGVREWAFFPDLALSLCYLDVDGEQHIKRMKLSLNLLSAGHEGVAHHSGQLPTFMQFAVNIDEA
jgi:hypothetical protein